MEIGRRETLFAALALVAPAGIVRAEGESEIGRLFAEWRAALVEVETSTDDEAGDRAFDRSLEIERLMVDLEPRTVADLARKVCAWVGLTSVDDDAGQADAMSERMVAELRSLAGNPRLATGREADPVEARKGHVAPPADDVTFRLIAAHEAAHAAHNDACVFSDDVALGREPTDDEATRYLAARDRAEGALHALCEHAPCTVRGAAAKAEHLRLWLRRNDFGDGDIEALLRSVAQAVAANGRVA